MKRFTNILYLADGEELLSSAFDRAMEISRANQAKLTVIDVLPEDPVSTEVENRLGLDLPDLFAANRRQALERQVEGYLGKDHSSRVMVLQGSSFIETIKTVLREHIDLVIKAARSPEGFGEKLLGSSDMHLLRKCPCPVWIYRPQPVSFFRQVLAAVDPLTEEGLDCARKVLSIAASIAERDGASLNVLHAWHLYGESTLRNGFSRVSITEITELLKQTEERHLGAVQRLIDEVKLDGIQPEVTLIKGDAAESIRQHSLQQHADLIVMGTVGRCGIPGFIIGNTAEEVLQTTTTSVLAVKPDTFVSPVTV